MYKNTKNFHHFEGVKNGTLELIQGGLRNNRLISLPEDYVNFLRETDGGLISDVEFYGSKEHFIKHRFFTFPDILNYNKRFLEHSFLFNRVIVGQDSQVFFVYDGQKKAYLLCDRISFNPIKAFRGFKELFQYLTDE